MSFIFSENLIHLLAIHFYSMAWPTGYKPCRKRLQGEIIEREHGKHPDHRSSRMSDDIFSQLQKAPYCRCASNDSQQIERQNKGNDHEDPPVRASRPHRLGRRSRLRERLRQQDLLPGAGSLPVLSAHFANRGAPGSLTSNPAAAGLRLGAVGVGHDSACRIQGKIS